MTIQRDDQRVQISDDDLPELLRLLKSADTTELKVSIPTENHRATIRGLPLDPVEAQPRQVFFFDTPDLDLNKAGVVVRARRIQGGRGDTVVKLRPIVPDELPDDIRHSGSLGVEVDMIPGGFVCSASMKGKSTGEEIRAVVAGEASLRKLFTKEQRAFYQMRAPAGIELDSLATLGPTFILKGAVRPRGARAAHRHRAVALPGRFAHPGTLDEVPTGRGVSRHRRVTGVSQCSRDHGRWRAADEDPGGARLLRGGAQGGGLSRLTRGSPTSTPRGAPPRYPRRASSGSVRRGTCGARGSWHPRWHP